MDKLTIERIKLIINNLLLKIILNILIYNIKIS